MLDYHLHLWPHGQRAVQATVEELAAYCERAAVHGVNEIALTEHLFRFDQADALLGGWWASEPDAPLRASVAAYWRDHVSADLDAYVDTCLAAKAAGLPVVIGMEVDYYAGRMDEVAELLAGYPFDVLLGSVHWLGAWLFDDLSSAVAMAEWDARAIEAVWDDYTRSLEELAATRCRWTCSPIPICARWPDAARRCPMNSTTAWQRPPRRAGSPQRCPRPAGANRPTRRIPPPRCSTASSPGVCR